MTNYALLLASDILIKTFYDINLDYNISNSQALIDCNALFINHLCIIHKPLMHDS